MCIRDSFKGLELTGDHAASGAIERKPVALVVGVTLNAEFLLGFVYDAIAGAGHAAPVSYTHLLAESGQVQATRVVAANDHGEGVLKAQRLGNGDVCLLYTSRCV